MWAHKGDSGEFCYCTNEKHLEAAAKERVGRMFIEVCKHDGSPMTCWACKLTRNVDKPINWTYASAKTFLKSLQHTT